MDIRVTWLDVEESILKTQVFEPDTQEWSEFEQKSLHEIINMGGSGCTHISMALV